MSELALIGKKIGMTREFYKTGQLVPVTVLKIEKARVIQIIDKEKRGYSAIQLGYGKIKNSKLTKAMKGFFAKKNTEAKKKLKEFRVTNIENYKEIPKEVIPDTESLKDTYERVLQYFKDEIQKKLVNKNILISAHGNSIRALCKYLFKLNNNQITNLEIPTGNPLIIELNKESKIKKCEYLDKERAKSLLVF